MKILDRGQEKVEKICEALRKETLEPAMQEAARIIEEAKVQRDAMISEAEMRADQALLKAKLEIEKERHVFTSSLYQASRQALEALRQEIETNLFNPELKSLIISNTTDPKICAQMIEALVKGIEKQGLASNLIALIPKSVSPQAVNALLLDSVLNKLKENSVAVGDFNGGAQVRLTHKKVTIDLSDEALSELVATYIRKDLRKFIFKE